MLRFLAVFVWLSSSVYGAGICLCKPTLFLSVNDVVYSTDQNFSITTLPANQGYLISGGVVSSDPQNPANNFALSLSITTNPDPAIGFDFSISGDPTVHMVITQFFLGGPFDTLVTAGGATLSDGNGDNQASLFGAPYLQTKVNGVVQNQLNLDCNVTGPSGPCPPPQPSQIASQISASDFGTLELDINFHLSDGDGAVLNGSTVLSAVPEPATGMLLATGLLGFAGLVWRRRKKA
jgi:hypothetical protein